jgi:GNAT superfamily N-acetyltransferase
MFECIEVATQEHQRRFCALPGLSPLTPEILAQHGAETALLLADEGGTDCARCSLWWSAAPAYLDHKLGLIGHYAARDDKAAGHILATACGRLASRGCTLAVGPMDGNTWRRYRLVTERGSEPPFFLEPDNPDDWPAHFTGNGFEPLAHYYSALNTNLHDQDPRIPDIAQRLADRGVTIRPLNLEGFEQELRSIYALSLLSFAENFLYTPIGEEEFLAQYGAIRPYVRPELVLIAEWKATQPIGYIFAVPDLAQAQRGQSPDTVIIKTLAVHPEHAGGGLGSLLTARCQGTADKLGYRRVIHALMHETNKSKRISSHTAKTIRRYTLFARAL